MQRFLISLTLLCLAAFAIVGARQVAPESAAVCLEGGRCIPMSIVKATFQGWQEGSAPPTNQVRQDLLASQAQLADTLKNYRQCEASLGPLQAQQHQTALQQAQQQLNDDNAKAAPPGMQWNPKSGRYETADKRKDGQ